MDKEELIEKIDSLIKELRELATDDFIIKRIKERRYKEIK